MADAPLSNKEKLLAALKGILDQRKGQRVDDSFVNQVLNAFGISTYTQEVLSTASVGFNEEALILFIAQHRLSGKSAHEIGSAIYAQFGK